MWLKGGTGVTNVAEGSDSQLWAVVNTAVNVTKCGSFLAN
jgi:hypothetical protein